MYKEQIYDFTDFVWNGKRDLKKLLYFLSFISIAILGLSFMNLYWYTYAEYLKVGCRSMQLKEHPETSHFLCS